MRKDRGKLRTGKSRKTRVSMFSTETRQRKRPLWKGDDTLCADGRSCEFFLMCWMTAGLLDGSCGGIMYACCQRKDPKALVDNNLIESPRDQSRPLPLDLYTETASDDRKSSLRQACPPSMSCGTVHLHEHESSPSVFLSPLFSLSLSLSLSLFLFSFLSAPFSRTRMYCTLVSLVARRFPFLQEIGERYPAPFLFFQEIAVRPLSLLEVHDLSRFALFVS